MRNQLVKSSLLRPPTTTPRGRIPRSVTGCSEAGILDRFWLEFSVVIPRLGGAESDEGLKIFGRPEGVYFKAGC
jgi:hypothetical protein